eukprot:scaffold2161_cov244-Pinguiococcus_pyrenoidosus.AAC.4
MLGAYHRSDIAFIANAADPATVVQNLETTVGEIMGVQNTEISGPGITSTESMGQANVGIDQSGNPMGPGPQHNLLRTHQVRGILKWLEGADALERRKILRKRMLTPAPVACAVLRRHTPVARAILCSASSSCSQR